MLGYGSAVVQESVRDAAVSWQLGVLALILLGLISATFVLTHIIERYGFPALEAAAGAAGQWLQRRNDRMSRFLLRGFESVGVELPLVVLLAGAVMGGMWLFLGILEDVITGDPLVAVDQAVFQLLQSLRSPLGDAGLVALAEFGDRSVIIVVVVVTSISLLLLRRWRAAFYLVVAALGSTLFVHGMKLVLHRPRPLQQYDGISEFSFPSGHATSSLAVYGFLAILLARSAPPTQRRLVIATTLSLVLLIAFSRLYLGAHWLSDVCAGLSFGTAWIASLAILYFRQERQALPSSVLTGVTVLTIILAGSWHISRTHLLDMHRYAPSAAMPSDKAQSQ